MSVDSVCNQVVQGYLVETKAVKAKHAQLVRDLTKEIDEVGRDRMYDHLSDIVDDAASYYASKASNQFETAGEQEEAISRIEAWFSSNVSNAETEAVVLCALTHGDYKVSTDKIRDEIITAVPSNKI